MWHADRPVRSGRDACRRTRVHFDSPGEVTPTDAVRHGTLLPLTESFGLPAVAPLLDLARARTAVAGEVVASEDAPDGRCRLVTMGVLGCFVTLPAGRRALIELLGPGDLLGDNALAWLDRRPLLPRPIGLAGLPRGRPRGDGGGPIPPEIRALSEARFVVWPAAVLADAIGRDQALRGWFEERMAARLRRVQRLLARSLALPLVDRLEQLLWDLAEIDGRPAPGGIRLRAPITQETLADATGAARESVNRALRTLESRGHLVRSGRLYTLPEARGSVPSGCRDRNNRVIGTGRSGPPQGQPKRLGPRRPA